MSKVKAVAVAVCLTLCASVSYAQGPPLTFPQNNQTGQSFYAPTDLPVPCSTPGSCPGQAYERNIYVACWAEVPSRSTAYFSATFAAPTVNVNGVRKEFRQFVTTQYGPVSKLQCTGKVSETVVNEQVEKWKDSARNKNAIVDT